MLVPPSEDIRISTYFPNSVVPTCFSTSRIIHSLVSTLANHDSFHIKSVASDISYHFDILLLKTEGERERREQKHFHLLAHSPNADNRWNSGCARAKRESLKFNAGNKPQLLEQPPLLLQNFISRNLGTGTKAGKETQVLSCVGWHLIQCLKH